MSSSDSHDDPSPDSGPVFSREAVTPRGGFMARPGLKPPPRHAVVVRVGDAPTSEAIPVARSSFPPPAPSEPPPISASDKATLRAIPSVRVPRLATVVFDEPPRSSVSSVPPAAHVALESAPPPSDSPVTQSIPPESSPRSRHRGSAWTIVAAGAAGLILGLLSVFATRGGTEAPAAARAPLVEVTPPAVVPEPPMVTTAAPEATAPVPSERPRAEPAAPKPAAAAMPKKSIF